MTYIDQVNSKTITLTSFQGLTKKEILKELGDGFNFYPDDIWYYELSTTWWGLKKVLFIVFENDHVKSKCIKKMYGKISRARL